MTDRGFTVEEVSGIVLLTLTSPDSTNRLTSQKVIALTQVIQGFSQQEPVRPLVITGKPAFSAGADLKEIARLNGPSAYEFGRMGQALMNAIADYPALIYAAIDGYCMGGGMDLALACHHRIAHPHAVLGHRGAALGLITGWGGTQRLPRLIGKAKALQMFVTAEKLHALDALRLGLVDALSDNPVEQAMQRLTRAKARSDGEVP